MGFFSNFFGNVKELSKLGNAVSNVKEVLDKYEIDPDRTYLLLAAWICKVGIIDAIENNNWPPNHFLYATINGHQTKMYISEVQMATVFRLKKKVSNLSDSSLESIIDDILDGGQSFYDVDRQIPEQTRNIILKNSYR